MPPLQYDLDAPLLRITHEEVNRATRLDIFGQHIEDTWVTPATELGTKMAFYRDHFLRLTVDGFIIRPAYMDVHMSHAMRIAIGQIRVSSHRLLIETGRATGIPSQDRICRLCHTEVETEEHYICRCPVYYEIRGRFHCLFADGFGPLTRVMDFPDQRCLALFLLEIRKHRDLLLRAPIATPVTQPTITSFYRARGDAEEERDTDDGVDTVVPHTATHSRRVRGVTVQRALAIQRTRRPRPPRGAPTGRQTLIRDILQRYYAAPRPTVTDLGGFISAAIDCPMADILEGPLSR